jgi:hypothetical protein
MDKESINKLVDAGRQAGREVERERCAKIAEKWLTTFGSYTPEHVSAHKWANDAVRDIADAIRKPADQ